MIFDLKSVSKLRLSRLSRVISPSNLKFPRLSTF